MRDLEKVDVNGAKIALGRNFDVAGHQQRCMGGPGQDDDRLVVGSVIATLGTEHLK